jgi:outer membrane protein assembly factor BamB
VAPATGGGRYTALLSINPDTGAVQRRALASPVSIAGGTPTLLDGAVYFTGTNGTVTAVSAADGRQLWQRATGLESLSAPVLSTAYGRLYFATRIGSVVALDRGTGAELWHTTALDSTGAGTDDGTDWPARLLLIKDEIVATAGLTAFSVNPDR